MLLQLWSGKWEPQVAPPTPTVVAAAAPGRKARFRSLQRGHAAAEGSLPIWLPAGLDKQEPLAPGLWGLPSSKTPTTQNVHPNFCKKLKWHFSSCTTYFLDLYPAFPSGAEGSLNPSTALVSQITQSPPLLASQSQGSAQRASATRQAAWLLRASGKHRASGHRFPSCLCRHMAGEACASCQSSWRRPSSLIPLLFGE